jgi:hypothetical protein
LCRENDFKLAEEVPGEFLGSHSSIRIVFFIVKLGLVSSAADSAISNVSPRQR